MKTFTLDEANALLPVLESLLRTAITCKQELERLQQQRQDLAHRIFLSGGSLLKISEEMARKSEREGATQRLRDTLAEIDSIGVQVKDLDIGLLDFPFLADGEIILLCWKMGEPSIGFWHTLDAGFAGRKPIDDRIAKDKKPN